MKKHIRSIAVTLLTAVMLAGCGPATAANVSAPPSATTNAESSVRPSPTNRPTQTTVPVPTMIPTPYPTYDPGPAPSEYVFKASANIPDIIEGDGRNLGNNYYENDEYLYYIDINNDVDILDDYSLCSINKTTKECVRLLNYCSSFCVEGDYIYWTELIKNNLRQINRYDIKTKENTVICPTEFNSYSIQADNGRLYYTMYRDNGFVPAADLYSMDINGGNSVKLIENVERYFIYNHNIFYMPYRNDLKTSICMYDTDSKNTTELAGNSRFETFSVANGKMFFHDDAEGCVASVDTASGVKKLFKDANYSSQLAVSGQYLFYANRNKNDYNYENPALRAYDIINDKYYDMNLYDYWNLDASNRNLYFHSYEQMRSLKISGGKASVVKVKEPTSPKEKIVVQKKNIPDVIEGDGRNLDNSFYEDDKYIYFRDNSYFPDWIEDKVYSICSINKTTGKYAELLKHGSEFCAQGDYIYWVEDDGKNKKSNIKQYDIKANKNTVVYPAEKFVYDIEADNGRLYYTMERGAEDSPSVYDLYSVDINGNNNEKLIDNAGSSFTKYKNYIFYNSHNSIYKYDVDSKNITELVDDFPYGTFSVAYGKLYFYDDAEGCIISFDIESGEKKILRDANSSGPTVLGQYLFYINANGDFDEYGNRETELRAYDMTSGKYYFIISEYLPDDIYDYTYRPLLFLEASNKNLYFYDDTPDYSNDLVLLKIYKGKASTKKLAELYGTN